MMDVGIKDKQDYLQAVEDLNDKKWIAKVGEEDFRDTFIIKEHFLSLSKSKLNLRKAIDEGKSSIWNKVLREIYEPDDFKSVTIFIPPTPEEATQHGLSLGYVVNGKTFVDHYASNDWYNVNNKKVRNWRQTLEKVWCKESNKLETAPNAPKGYEYFHITLDNGERVSPEGWRKGRPTHSNYLHTELLNDEYNLCIMKKQEST